MVTRSQVIEGLEDVIVSCRRVMSDQTLPKETRGVLRGVCNTLREEVKRIRGDSFPLKEVKVHRLKEGRIVKMT